MVVIRTIKNRNAVSGKVSEENDVLEGICSVKFRFSDLKNQAVRFANVLITLTCFLWIVSSINHHNIMLYS